MAAAGLKTRQEELAEQRAALDAKIKEATAPATSSQKSQAEIVNSLASAVEELRCNKPGMLHILNAKCT